MTRNGYVLIVTMMVIAASMMIVTTVVQRAAAYKNLSSYVYAREKAKTLALSGVQIALAQLGPIGQEKDEQKQIASLLLLIDRKQTFTLREEVDGMDGEIAITIGSEQGKININALYDFKKHQFVGDPAFANPGLPARQAPAGTQGEQPNQQGQESVNGKKLLQLICDKVQPKIKEKELFGRLERFLKERKKPLLDPTELVEVMQYKKGNNSTEELRSLFTVFTDDAQIQPLLLSPAVSALFSFKPWADTEEARKKQLEDVSKKIKSTVQWAQEWNTILGAVYGKDYAAVPAELRPALNAKFESNWLSVISYGVYNSITQKLCVVLEREVSQEKDALSVYHVRRMYWL